MDDAFWAAHGIHRLPEASPEERARWAWNVFQLVQAARQFLDHARDEGWQPMMSTPYGDALREAVRAFDEPVTQRHGEEP